MRRLALVALLVAGSCGASSRGFGGGTGPICGSRVIVGEVIPGIDGRGACGVRRPVRVHAVAGVVLSPQPTITCDAARALERWVARGVELEVARAGARLTGLVVADHYSCRNRNRGASGRLSEHARGRAIDISAFRLADGHEITVSGDWHGERYGGLLRRIHAAGCGPFGTTLGPGSDAYHEDHLHYDVAKRKHGSYCR